MLMPILRPVEFFLARCTPSKETGQGLIEYALIILMVVMGVIFFLGVFGGELQNAYQLIAEAIPVGE